MKGEKNYAYFHEPIVSRRLLTDLIEEFERVFFEKFVRISRKNIGYRKILVFHTSLDSNARN